MAVWPGSGTVAMVGVPRLVRALLRVVVLWLVIPRILRTTHDIEQQHERAEAHRDQRPPLVPALACGLAATGGLAAAALARPGQLSVGFGHEASPGLDGWLACRPCLLCSQAGLGGAPAARAFHGPAG